MTYYDIFAIIIKIGGNMESVEEKIKNIIKKDIDVDIFTKYYSELKHRLIKTSYLCEQCFVLNKNIDEVLIDSICLQLRKCLELIAMSSLISNKDVFLDIKTKIFNQWRGKSIINEIKKYSKFVFPIKSYKYINFDHNKLANYYSSFEEIKENVLTEDVFCEIYDICSDFLHVKNPYGTDKNVDYKKIIENIGKWMDCIFNTYSLCKITPYGNERKIYLLHFGDVKDINTNVYIHTLFLL